MTQDKTDVMQFMNPTSISYADSLAATDVFCEVRAQMVECLNRIKPFPTHRANQFVASDVHDPRVRDMDMSEGNAVKLRRLFAARAMRLCQLTRQPSRRLNVLRAPSGAHKERPARLQLCPGSHA